MANFTNSHLLRVPCQLHTDVGLHFHKHECPACKHVWAHIDALPELGLPEAEFAEAHTCEKCGHEQYDKLIDHNEFAKQLNWWASR